MLTFSYERHREEGLFEVWTKHLHKMTGKCFLVVLCTLDINKYNGTFVQSLIKVHYW
jgi:hypothetical protein